MRRLDNFLAAFSLQANQVDAQDRVAMERCPFSGRVHHQQFDQLIHIHARLFHDFPCCVSHNRLLT